MYVIDIYNAIDELANFSTAESWDNCGMLIGDMYAKVTGVITCLDITIEVVEEAIKKGVNLIVSHHPIIFSAMKSIPRESIQAKLLINGISAICVHTPFDMAPLGMNAILREKLGDELGIIDSEMLEQTGENLSIGMIYTLAYPLFAEDIAPIAKKALGCSVVRYNRGGGLIFKLAISSGAGSSMRKVAIEKGANALIAGDFKHSDFVDSMNEGFTIIDCGHYHTEIGFNKIMAKWLQNKFKDLDVKETECGEDPVEYVI